ncbi:replication initiation protein [Levilactobacillus acidifarinae]|uniref:Initiator Rep protein WH1 domain-containing protein n=1 Tax=Levilactobacillus acidifarinae DSM 19394 = JCM 15949 TaxID=1423715 RepID=A0A0R1LRY4_9LACO|nr:replication initiation protein [Levilactobacillus acidifarinae]KRK95940.1 hypothetical protein FD25_GL002401 [Levilactobacillus acidifarinae DSM 19394]GEO69244.1 hypothetical protein LAC03_11540 [Levilactobacillus acidifarinae]
MSFSESSVQQASHPLGYDVVKWDNAMNDISLASLSVVEMNLFTAICAQIVEREADEIHLSYSALRELMQYKNRSTKRFAKMVLNATRQIRHFSVSYKHGTKIGEGQLFYNIEADTVTGDVTVTVNRRVLGVLNDLTNNFTLFLQPDWVRLNSKYAKMIYLMVMQWRTTGRTITISVEDFRRRLGIPQTMKTAEVTRQIIKPTVKQLNTNGLIPNFKITPIKEGYSYTKYQLSFDPLPRLKNVTSHQLARINRLSEIATAKNPATANQFDETERRILANGALNGPEAHRRVQQNRLEQQRQLPQIPIFKLTD